MSSTAIAASATAISAANSARIAEENKQQCILYVEGFDNLKSSTVEKQHYAECIETLYPQEMTGDEVVLAKICIIALFIGLIVGCVKGYKDGYDWMDVPLYGILGVCATAVAILTVGLIIMGLGFLFS